MIVPSERIATCRDCNAEFAETNPAFTVHELCMPTKCRKCRGDTRVCAYCGKNYSKDEDGARNKYCSFECSKNANGRKMGKEDYESKQKDREERRSAKAAQNAAKANCLKCGIRIGIGKRYKKCPKCRLEDAEDQIEQKRAARWAIEKNSEKTLGRQQMRGFTAEALFDVIAASNGFVPFAPSGINFPSIDRVVMDGSFEAKRVQIKRLNESIWAEKGLLHIHNGRPINWSAVDWLAFVHVEQLWVAVVEEQQSNYSEGWVIDQSLHIWTMHRPIQPPGGLFS